ncbi:MAG: YcgN family cysteine cluster protein [Porticoccaceae bacterium]|nr:YcgN family cysteine cluster protein [Porticoccaceae bacterium]
MSEFWQTKKLHQMTSAEWESLCDGCGKCCLVKLEDFDTAEIYHTDLACKLLNINACRCSDYKNRQKQVDDCVKLDPKNLESIQWLPDTCSYKLIEQGKPLPDWHHLRTGNRDAVHQVLGSVRHFATSEVGVKEHDLEQHIIQWVD